MIMSIILGPLLTKAYTKFEAKKEEKNRQIKYKKYIDHKKFEIKKGINEQEETLKNTYLSASACASIIINKSPSLWQRRIQDEDYLEVNLGLGNLPMKIT